MDETSQIYIPESFQALYLRPGRSKPDIPLPELIGRYEQCEAMAMLLQETASNMIHSMHITEQDVLERCHLGLSAEGQPFSQDEAVWVVRRLAELMGWPAGANLENHQLPEAAG